jgi:hypothetical protein
MALVVGVHGIAQQLLGANQLEAAWLPALRDGVAAAGGTVPPEALLRMAFYGGLYRDPGHQRAAGDRAWRPEELADDEAELLLALWQAAAEAEPARVMAPAAVTRGTPQLVQKGLLALSRSKFFTSVSQSAMIGDLKQVRRYLREPALREAAQRAVHDTVQPDTRVLIAHSLGSVVAYEALHRHGHEPNWAQLDSLITLGSPLGIPNLIFEALQPAPQRGIGAWPPRIRRWVNISDDGDIVALCKQLAPLFGGGASVGTLTDLRVSNEAKAHDARPYLSAGLTGQALLNALR